MLWQREAFLDHLCFGKSERELVVELFGPLIGTEDRWREQGASEEEINLTAFAWDQAHMGPGWMYPDDGEQTSPTFLDALDIEFGEDVRRQRERDRQTAHGLRDHARINFKKMCRASEWYDRQRENLEFDGEQEKERKARIARFEAELLAEQQEAQEL